MLIESIHLENIKSYERADVSFAEGTNAICGPNGAGKSTLIEAVGFALFGSQRVRLEQMIRSGASHGRIEIRFVSSLDELSYHVVREVRRSGPSSVVLVSEDLQAAIATGAREVQDQLVQHLGLRPGVKLPSLFDGVVGVPQGHLTYDFLLSPAPRKARFEELLSLQEFELAHQRLSGPMQHGRTQAAALHATVAAMTEQLSALPSLEARLAELGEQARSLGEALKAAEATLLEARAARIRLDEHQAAVQAAREQAAAARAARDLADQQLAEATRRCDEAMDAARRAAESRPAHDQYLDLDAQVRALEADLAKRDTLRGEQHRLDSEAARIDEGLRRLAQSLDEAKLARDRLAALQPSLEQQMQLERAESATEEALHAAQAARQEAARLLALREGHVRQLRAAEATIEPLKQAAAKRDKLLAARAKATATIALLRAEYLRLQSQLGAEEAALDAVEQGGDVVCPACGRPFAGGDSEALRAHFMQRRATTCDEAAAVEKRGKRLRKATEFIERHLVAAEEASERLRQSQAKVQGVRQSLDTLDTQLREAEERAAPLAQHQETLAAIEAQLLQLGDPRTDAAKLRVKADTLPDIERDIFHQREKLNALGAKQRALASQLSLYAGADDALRECRARRDGCRDGYDAYRRDAPIAAQLPVRQQDAARRQRALVDADEALESAAARHDDLAAQYDTEAHRAARAAEMRCEVEAASLRAQIAAIEEQTAEGQRRRQELLATQERLQQARQSLAETETALSALRVLREAVRLAGPEIARRLLARVSSAANRMFSEMMNDYAVELIWRDDYGITLRRGAEQRDFAQLSGGEQMTAALGVRLALLREVSDVGIAFFDEPTVNLDEERRQNLAEQLRNIHDFRQLFVISHDDSLEGVTDHIIRISKENGVSRIEQG